MQEGEQKNEFYMEIGGTRYKICLKDANGAKDSLKTKLQDLAYKEAKNKIKQG